MNKKLHPCVAFLDNKSEEEIRELQKELYKLTGAKASLEEWRPHITVGKALNLVESEYSQLFNDLEIYSKSQVAFEVELKNFGYMDDWKGSKLFNCEPYVVYVEVVVNNKLANFVKKLDGILSEYDYSYDIFPYKPHLTLVFKDLTEDGFKKAKDFLKKKAFSKTVKINSFSITTDKIIQGVFDEVKNFKFSIR